MYFRNTLITALLVCTPQAFASGRGGGGNQSGDNSSNIPPAAKTRAWYFGRTAEVQALKWMFTFATTIDEATTLTVSAPLDTDATVLAETGRGILEGNCTFSSDADCGPSPAESYHLEDKTRGIYALVGTLQSSAALIDLEGTPAALTLMSASFAAERTRIVVKIEFKNGDSRSYECSQPSNYYSNWSCHSS